MKIYTSYFGNIKRLKYSDIVPVNIALYKPKWFQGISLGELAPLRFMLDDRLSENEYIELYQTRVLNKLNVSLLFANLQILSGGKDVALCCYEKPNEFCHRHILADWLSKHLNVEIGRCKSITLG